MSTLLILKWIASVLALIMLITTPSVRIVFSRFFSLVRTLVHRCSFLLRLFFYHRYQHSFCLRFQYAFRFAFRSFLDPTSLTSGYNYVLLNYGYNYFQIAATANYGVELATTDYNSYCNDFRFLRNSNFETAVQIAPLSSCTPVSWPYSASLSSTQSVVFYPNSTQVISIYSWQTAHYAYLDVTLSIYCTKSFINKTTSFDSLHFWSFAFNFFSILLRSFRR